MKSKSLILFMTLLCYGQISNSQNQEDTIKHFLIVPLIKDQPTAFLLDDFYEIWGKPPPYQPEIRFFDDSIFLTVVAPYNFIWVWGPPACGETYHDNGKISSRVECKESIQHGKTTYWNQSGIKTSESDYINGELHGKSINWNDSGHKTKESTYAFGRIFKEKNYAERSRIISIEHFNYAKDGSRRKNGFCVYYDDYHEIKIEERYKNGFKHGYFREYHNHILVEQTQYQNDVIIGEKIWDLFENLIYAREYDSEGNLVFEKNWNNKGVLSSEEFYLNGKPDGDWYNYSHYSDRTTLTHYENGLSISVDVYQGEIKIAHYDKIGGVNSYGIGWHKNGQKSFEKFYFESGYRVHSLRWDEQGRQLDDFTEKGRMYLGPGFYTLKDTLISFTYGDTLDIKIPLKRWIIFKGDTVREEYAINSMNNPNQVLSVNKFKKDKPGKYERNGMWKFYNGNSISHVLTYDLGQLNGRAIYYCPADSDYYAFQYGNYLGGIKDSEWIVKQDSMTYLTTYKFGVRYGKYMEISNDTDTLLMTNYLDDKRNGVYVEYYSSGELKVTGYHKTGIKTGYWTFHYPTGEIKEEGTYLNDNKIGKWIFWERSKNGKLKKRRVKSPDIV